MINKRSLFFIAASLMLMSGNALAAGYSVDANADDEISFDLLQYKIESDKKIQALEDVLNLIPPKFLENYVLVYRSRSLQQSSFLYPRAIVFGKSGKFIFSFNGHPDQRGYNKLEIIQFRDKTNSFEFREIAFRDGEAPVISAANPPRCIECHQSPNRTTVDMRPNWEPYNFWPGVYGSVDEKLEPVLKTTYDKYNSGDGALYAPLDRFEAQDLFLIDEQAQERASLKRFVEEIKPIHRRYSFLPEYNLRNPLSLTKITVILNFRRIVRLMRESLGSLFETYKYAVAGLARQTESSSTSYQHRCGDLYIPESAKLLHIEALKKLRLVNESDYVKTSVVYNQKIPVAKGLELIFEPLGIDTADWSLDFKTGGRFSFDQDRFTSPHDSTVHLFDALKLLEPDVVKLTCEELKAKSMESLEKFAATGGLASVIASVQNVPVKPMAPLINRCVRCHAMGDDMTIPRIPFHDLAQLQPLLTKGKYPRGRLIDEIRYRTSDHATNLEQMPPNGLVSKQQRDELVEALAELAK